MRGIDQTQMKEQMNAAKASLVREYEKLSPLLKACVLGGIAFAVFFVVYSIVEKAYGVLEDQALAIEQVESTITELGPKLDSYARLRAHRDAIEDRYKEVEIKEGALAYLEHLVSTKAGVPAGQFTLQEKGRKEFGGNFEQVTYSIRFSTNDMKALTGFLNELVHGPHPLILGRLELAMNSRGDALDVDLDATTIKRAGGA